MAGTDSICDPAAPAQLAYPAAGAAQWPDHTTLELGALPSAVPCVRLHTKLVLREWHMTALADAAELVASELTTNAIQASTAAQQIRAAGQAPASLAVVRLHLACDRRQVLVEVGDDDPRSPTPAKAEPERDGGRGLLLVEAASNRWGCYYLNPAASPAWRAPGPVLTQPSTKVVWALITR